MRDLHAASESCGAVSGKTGLVNPPGGLWLTKVPEEQESALLGTLYKLFLTMAEHDIPVTLLRFPRLVKEPEYLYRKIRLLRNLINSPMSIE